MKKYSIFWGIVVLGCGVLLLLQLLGIGTQFALIPVIGSILLLAVSLTSLFRLNFIMGFLPLAGIAYLWRDKLGQPDLNLWLLLLAALLLGGGLSMIFKKARRRRFPRQDNCGKNYYSDVVISSMDEDEFVNIDSNFGEHTRYVRSSHLKKITVDSNFSSVKVYFDQCQPSPEGLTIDVDCNFSGVVLYIPRTWGIDNQMHTFAGSVSGTSLPTGDCAVVTLVGDVNFGEVKIQYI